MHLVLGILHFSYRKCTGVSSYDYFGEQPTLIGVLLAVNSGRKEV